MVYDPNANWTAEIDKQQQAPVYYIDIDGHATDYSTHPVSGASTTVLMDPPKGGGRKVDVISGRQSIASLEVELLDISDEITDLVATEAPGAPVSTLINRKVTVYGGYKSLASTDYAPIFTGYIRKVRMNRELTGYILTLQSPERLLVGEIMSDADPDAATPTKATIQGNIVNILWSIMSGTFSTTHGTFPLDSVSVAGTGTVAPTGLGIASAAINETQMTDQRDTWHANDKVKFVFTEPVEAKAFLEQEIFRVFQCWPAVSADGKIGLRFHVPALPAAAAPAVTTDDHIIDVRRWERLYADHLNKFTIRGDYDEVDDEYDTELHAEEDTTDQTATGETVEYFVESRGLQSSLDGAEIAAELAGRMKIRYLKTPALVDLTLNFRRRNIEEGDVIAVTDSRLPNLVDGTKGLSAHLMTVISIVPDFVRGVLTLRCLETGYKRYGVIAPNTQADFASATDQEKATFFFICDNSASGAMSDASQPYRLI